ncbi:hypothetical protein B0H13DRAFT_1895779 [Mycena leptocephala]|nr:hypothetical protein B0H13DRAFT_1895779 [Mycena leptocephala]
MASSSLRPVNFRNRCNNLKDFQPLRANETLVILDQVGMHCVRKFLAAHPRHAPPTIKTVATAVLAEMSPSPMPLESDVTRAMTFDLYLRIYIPACFAAKFASSKLMPRGEGATILTILSRRHRPRFVKLLSRRLQGWPNGLCFHGSIVTVSVRFSGADYLGTIWNNSIFGRTSPSPPLGLPSTSGSTLTVTRFTAHSFRGAGGYVLVSKPHVRASRITTGCCLSGPLPCRKVPDDAPSLRGRGVVDTGSPRTQSLPGGETRGTRPPFRRRHWRPGVALHTNASRHDGACVPSVFSVCSGRKSRLDTERYEDRTSPKPMLRLSRLDVARQVGRVTMLLSPGFGKKAKEDTACPSSLVDFQSKYLFLPFSHSLPVV